MLDCGHRLLQLLGHFYSDRTIPIVTKIVTRHVIVLLKEKLYRCRNICTGVIESAVEQTQCVGTFLGQLVMRG